MAKSTKKWVLSVFATILTLFMVFSMIEVPKNSGVLALAGTVASKGQRTIKQNGSVNATDLHFVVYQADVNNAYIINWGIGLSVPFTSMTASPSTWPINDGKTHSVAIDIYGINVPPGATVKIDATLYLNTWNTVKFKDIHWTYKEISPVKPVNADIGWAVKTNPGTSNGGWLISKYTATDPYKNQIVDLVGHEFTTANVAPVFQDMMISNGTPDNPGSMPVTITNWSVAMVKTLPTWDEIDNYQRWSITIPGPIVINPGQIISFPRPTPTQRVTPPPTARVTPTPTRVATPTPIRSVISTGRRTITQTGKVNATDLHFVVYQADVNTAYIMNWAISLSVPFTTMKAAPSSWPFSDGKIHSVAIDIYGIDVPPGATVDIEATLYLNTWNTVKFADIYWTYKDQEPVEPIGADIGWSVVTKSGTSSGGWLISKYTAVDKNKNKIVDLVGHEFKPNNVAPVFSDLNISNGTPINPGSMPVTIYDWSVAMVKTLPTFDEIDAWQKWSVTVPGPITLYPGETIRFPVVNPTPTPTGIVITRPPTGVVTNFPTARAITNKVRK